MMTVPSRTCLGCRRARPKNLLARLVRLADGTVVADTAGSATGRGAYVCPDADCLEKGLSSSRLARAFRKPSQASPDLATTVSRLATTICDAGAIAVRA